MECGRLVQNEEREDGGLPTIVKPGFSEMLLFEKNVIREFIRCFLYFLFIISNAFNLKQPGIGGVCGVLSYTVEVALDEEPDYIHVSENTNRIFQRCVAGEMELTVLCQIIS